MFQRRPQVVPGCNWIRHALLYTPPPPPSNGCVWILPEDARRSGVGPSPSGSEQPAVRAVGLWLTRLCHDAVGALEVPLRCLPIMYPLGTRSVPITPVCLAFWGVLRSCCEWDVLPRPVCHQPIANQWTLHHF